VARGATIRVELIQAAGRPARIGRGSRLSALGRVPTDLSEDLRIRASIGE
jgi:hypothetical protein